MEKGKIRLEEEMSRLSDEEKVLFIHNTWFIIKDRVGDKLVLKEAKSASDLQAHMAEITAKLINKFKTLYFPKLNLPKLSGPVIDHSSFTKVFDASASSKHLPLEQIAHRSINQMIHRAMATSETKHFNLAGPKYNKFKFDLSDSIYQKEFGGEFSKEAVFGNSKVAGELLPLLFDTFDSTINMINWLDSPLQALEYLKPSEAIFIDKVDDVIDELYRLKDGVYI